jgi:small subunit ribosomal protein S13
MKPENPEEKKEEEMLVRIISTDIPGSKRLIAGLTRIKGVSWALANAVCNVLKLDKDKKVNEVSKEEIEKITSFFQKPQIPEFMLNRRKDFETGENKHIVGSDLRLRTEFDIKRLKKIKCFRGLRHSAGQPVRGQRTKAHFRENKAIGVAKRKKK